MRRVFINEKKIGKIGGAVERNYYHFRSEILYLNEYIMPLFVLLGFKQEDKDKIIETLLAPSPLSSIRIAYIEKELERIKRGTLKIERLLPSKTLEEREETPEEREKRIDRAITSSIKKNYKRIFSKYLDEYKECTLAYNKFALNILKNSLNLEPTGFSINVDKYIEIYSDYLEANGTTTYKEHKAVADAINHFFGGAVEITINELERYFRIENGIIIPNPQAINKEAYIRLGYRGKCKIVKK